MLARGARRQREISLRLALGAILSAEEIEIVGVSRDTLYANLREAAPPQLFVPYVQQRQVRRLTYQIRTQVPPETMWSRCDGPSAPPIPPFRW